MTGGLADGGVTQAVAHGGELTDGAVEFVGFRGEEGAVDGETAVGGEHAGDFVKGEASGTAEGDEGETVEDGGLVLTAEAATGYRSDESSFFIEAECGGGETAFFAHFADIE